MLADTKDDTVFALDSIRIIISFLWSKFFWKIMLRIFIPYIVYMIFTVVYITYIYEKSVEINKTASATGLDYFFIAVVLAFIAYFLYNEFR